MNNKRTEISEGARKLLAAACPNVKDGVYMYDRFKTLKDIRNPKSWDEFWNSSGSPFPRGEWRRNELAEVFAKGWVKLEPLPENGMTLEITQDAIHKAYGGGRERHTKIKALAAMWLASQGENNIMFECSMVGAKADVYGKDLDCWIECGNTTADRIMDSLFYAGCNSFVVFPFVSHGMVEGYRFTTTISKEDIEAWKQEQLFKDNAADGLL